MSERSVSLDPLALRQAFGAVPSSVVALAAVVDEKPIGLAASTFVPVSLAPPLVAFCVQYTSTTWPALRECPSIGVSVLGSGHSVAARQLAGPGNRFADLATTTADTGAVLLDDSAVQLECAVHEEVPAGDHLIVVLKVLTISAAPDAEPLLFHRSSFRILS